MAGITIELSEYVIDAIADAVVKKMQRTTTETLDKIRAEIAALDDVDYDYDRYYKAVTDVLEIIDKYKAGSEEV